MTRWTRRSAWTQVGTTALGAAVLLTTPAAGAAIVGGDARPGPPPPAVRTSDAPRPARPAPTGTVAVVGVRETEVLTVRAAAASRLHLAGTVQVA